jgi:hypothetical protein
MLGGLIMAKTVLIDPPRGWLYGFPKPIPQDCQHRTLAWLVENGYPQKEIDSYGDYFYCRYLQVEEEDVENTSIKSKG